MPRVHSSSERHVQVIGRIPRMVATDRGFGRKALGPSVALTSINAGSNVCNDGAPGRRPRSVWAVASPHGAGAACAARLVLRSGSDSGFSRTISGDWLSWDSADNIGKSCVNESGVGTAYHLCIFHGELARGGG
jgi:hypothetical protein